MKTSCIAHPPNNPLIMIRQWQIEFCDGDHCAAALLSVFEFFHNMRLGSAARAEAMNDVAERYRDERVQDESLLQFYSADELEAKLLGLYGRDRIRAARQRLQNLGVIDEGTNPNPRYAFDRTIWFLFHPEVCNEWLESYHHVRQIAGRVAKNPRPSAENRNPSAENRNSSLVQRDLSETPSGTPDDAIASAAAASPAAPKRKRIEPSLTDEERARLHEDFDIVLDGGSVVEETIDLALSHKAARNYPGGPWYLYVRGWLRRDAERHHPAAARANGKIAAAPGKYAEVDRLAREG